MNSLQEMHAGIERGLEAAVQERSQCKWYQWQQRARLNGVIEALAIMDEMTHILMRKYDNSHGQLN